jgi:hypothetical protein
MARKLRLYRYIPVLYLGVIGLLIYLQLSAVSSFSIQMGDMEVVGVERTGMGRRPAQLRQIEIRYSGLRFMFTRSRPLLLGPSRRRLHPSGWEGSDDKVSVAFASASGVSTRLIFRDEGDALRIEISDPQAVAIPLESNGGALRVLQGIPVVVSEQEGTRLLVYSGDGSAIDWSGGYLYLEENNRSFRVASTAVKDPYLAWFASSVRLADRAEVEGAVSAFLDRAYVGWTRDRVDRRGRGWVMADGQVRFSGRLAAALLAEALRRGEYREALARVADASRAGLAGRSTVEADRTASAFLGGLEAYRDDAVETDGRRAEATARLLESAQTDILQAEAIVPLLLRSGSIATVNTLIERLTVFAESRVDPPGGETDAARVVGVVEAMADLRTHYPRGFARVEALEGAVLRRLFPVVRTAQEGLYVSSRSGVDVYLTVRAGAALLRLSEGGGSEVSGSLGTTLIVSALALADRLGFLPVTLVGETPSAESLPPEDVYHFLGPWSFFPERYPLDPGSSQANWIFTAAQLDAEGAISDTLRLRLRFPIGVSHYVLLHGVPTPARLVMKEIQWRPDPEYFRYRIGWYYDPQGGSLFLKVDQEQEVEEVLLEF